MPIHPDTPDWFKSYYDENAAEHQTLRDDLAQHSHLVMERLDSMEERLARIEQAVTRVK